MVLETSKGSCTSDSDWGIRLMKRTDITKIQTAEQSALNHHQSRTLMQKQTFMFHFIDQKEDTFV